VSESELIERSDELMAIEQALDAADGKDGCCAWIEGPAGIGKTSLLDEACRMGAARGFRVFEATGVELERGFPFGVVRQLYEPVLRGLDPAEREALAQGAAAVFGAAGPDGGDADLSFQVLHGLYWLVAELAQRDPLLIAIDDAQWADYPSLRHLLYLCRRLEGLAVIVMIAERTGEEAPMVLDELREMADSRIEPRPLSASGAVRLARAIFYAEPSPDFISASVERTGGSPLYLRETLVALRDEDLRPDDSSIEAVGRIDAEGLARHVWRRIESVDRAAPSVAGAIAVLGERARPGRVALLSDVPAARVAEIVEQLRGRGILDGGDIPHFTHPVVRAAVEARISAGQLDTWHRSAARLLDREGAGADRVAGHLLSCLPEDDPWVVERLREFAATAVRRGAPDLAASALARALEEPPPTDVRAKVLWELASAEDAAGDADEALAHLAEASRRSGDSESRAEIAIARAQILASTNRFPEAVAVLDREIERIGESDPVLQQRIDAELITYALFSEEARGRGLERLASYAGQVPEGPAAQPILTAMAVGVALTGERAAESAELAERALREGGFRNGGLTGELWFIAAWILIFSDRPDLAESSAREKLEATRSEGRVREVFAVELTLACARYRQGALPDAVSGARAALTIADPGAHRAWAHGVHALALLDSGELEAVEGALEAAEPEHWHKEAPGSFSLFWARAQLRLEQGRHDEAAADLEVLRRRGEADGPGLRTNNDVRHPVEVLLAHRRGEAKEARELAAAELDVARRFGGDGYVGTMLRISGIVAEPDDRLSFLRESVDVLEGSVFRVEHARSLVELGAELRRRGERTAAREPLAEGLDLAYRCGASRVVSQAMEELRAAGARPRRAVREGPDALTATESRMAVLAASGRSNREIAQELCVTLKTVEGTLMRAYAKLGISGRGARAALPEALGPLYAEA
jgi:DNA-binding CsgD family transcriptional regulator